MNKKGARTCHWESTTTLNLFSFVCFYPALFIRCYTARGRLSHTASVWVWISFISTWSRIYIQHRQISVQRVLPSAFPRIVFFIFRFQSFFCNSHTSTLSKSSSSSSSSAWLFFAVTSSYNWRALAPSVHTLARSLLDARWRFPPFLFNFCFMCYGCVATFFDTTTAAVFEPKTTAFQLLAN